MLRAIRTLFVLFVITLSSCSRQEKQTLVLHPQKTGIATVRFYDQGRERPLVTEVWYPIDKNTPAESMEGLWIRCAEARNAPLKIGKSKYPLVVMSHGNGGDRLNTSWLAEILAANGYIVASMDHHGNTWNNKIAECFLKIWERPQDVSFVIDKLLDDDRFGSHINRDKIGFIGYSLGGQTGVWIAGGEIENYPDLKLIPPDQLPEGITQEMLENFDFSPLKKSYRDARVSAVFLMAPALGYMFDLNSLQAITIPVHIWASEGDIVAPVESSAKILAGKMQKGVLSLIPGGANHYVYLNEVTKGGKMLLDKRLAFDPQGVDRASIHEEIGQSAIQFFNKYLK